MDYREMIERLRYIVEHGDEDPAEYCTNHCGRCALCDDAADTIETLLAERDAAVEGLRYGGVRHASIKTLDWILLLVSFVKKQVE